MRVAILAGEASGDMYGAELAHGLRELLPGVDVCGMGGPQMRRAGVRLFRDTSSWGAIGVVNALKVAPKAVSGLLAFRRQLRSARPDVLVPIDFGAFNVRAGREARSLGIPVYYFVVPGAWRKTGPISPKLLAAADVFCTQLPWHAERLRAAGALAEFHGHPLLDTVRPSATRDELRRSWAIPSGQEVVCLLPGSRRHEIDHILPPFLGAAALMGGADPGLRFVLGLAEAVDRRLVERILQRCGWRASQARDGRQVTGGGAADGGREILVVAGRAHDCLAVSDAALCASGTVTLEAAILRVPQVIAYCGSFLMLVQYHLFARRTITYVGLPNLLLGAPVCPELLGASASPEALAEACGALLGDGQAGRRQREALQRLDEVLGRPGAIRQAAERIVEVGAAGHA